MKRILFGMFLSLIAIFTFGSANAETITVDVPTVVMSAPAGSTDNFYVTLQKADDNAPMPGSDSKMTLTIVGSKEGKFGGITYSKEGLYKYRIYQENMTLKNIKYDTTVYDYLVQITIQDGVSFKASTALKKVGTDEKSTVALFSNLARSSDDGKKETTPSDKPVNPVNPFTGDKIIKYFIIAVVSILVILIIIIYVKRSKEDD